MIKRNAPNEGASKMISKMISINSIVLFDYIETKRERT